MWQNHVWAKTWQSCKTFELFNPSLQPSCMGLHASPVLDKWPFRWQCLVSSSVSCLRWYLFSCNSPQICVTGSSSRKHCTHLCLNMGYEYSRWALLIQPWMAYLADVSEIPQVGSCPVNEYADPLLAFWSTVSFLKFFCLWELTSVV
jgi:hypothetical protein